MGKNNPLTSRTINGIEAPQEILNADVMCLGFGKSATFVASLMPQETEVMIVTNHAKNTSTQFNPTQLYSKWDQERPIAISYTDADEKKRIEQIKSFMQKTLISGKKLVIPITTDPDAGKRWLEEIMKDEWIKNQIQSNPNICFLLMQSPNPNGPAFENTGRIVIHFDYYPGIGNYDKNPELRDFQLYLSEDFDPTNSAIDVKAGVKEETWYCIANKEQMAPSDISAIIQHFTANQRTREISDPEDMAFMITNALLHVVGQTVHIAQALIDKGLLPKSILSCPVSDLKEAFTTFYVSLNKYLNDIQGSPEKCAQVRQAVINYNQKEKGFYKDMPAFGPNVLMIVLSDYALQTHEAFKDQSTSTYLDDEVIPYLSPLHILNHLGGKYRKQFEQQRNEKLVDFLEDPEKGLAYFIHNNPPYQNKGIKMPITKDGSVNFEHRFTTEELPSLRTIMEKAMEIRIRDQDSPLAKERIETVNAFQFAITTLEKLQLTLDLGQERPRDNSPNVKEAIVDRVASDTKTGFYSHKI